MFDRTSEMNYGPNLATTNLLLVLAFEPRRWLLPSCGEPVESTSLTCLAVAYPNAP